MVDLTAARCKTNSYESRLQEIKVAQMMASYASSSQMAVHQYCQILLQGLKISLFVICC